MTDWRGTHPVVLSFASHRARGRAGVDSKDTLVTATGQRYIAVYSFRRASHGYYAMTKEDADKIMARKIVGVRKLRGPYDDLLRCWVDGKHDSDRRS